MSENETADQEESLMGGGSAATRPLWLYASDAHVWHKVAGVSGMVALAMGTYGAHIFKPENPAYKDVWNTANLYHLVHTAALLGAPLTKRPHIVNSVCLLLLHCSPQRVLESYVSKDLALVFSFHFISHHFELESRYRVHKRHSWYMYLDDDPKDFGPECLSCPVLTLKDVTRTVDHHHTQSCLFGLTPVYYGWQFGGLLTLGIVTFSGSCYTTALMENKDWSFPAPFGGFALISAWASLLF